VGGAVLRNRIKRLVREVFRTQLSSFPPHSDVVVIAKKTETVPGFMQARTEILGCIEKLCQRWTCHE
jgi:ribonuclease P protein component